MEFKYFTREEFHCQCGKCTTNEIKDELIAKLDKARDIAGVPFRINSGYRCPSHNASVGGSPNSLHKHGRAADIHVADNHSRYMILKGLFEAGLERVLIYKNFIHADIAGEGKQGEISLWMG